MADPGFSWGERTPGYDFVIKIPNTVTEGCGLAPLRSATVNVYFVRISVSVPLLVLHSNTELTSLGPRGPGPPYSKF